MRQGESLAIVGPSGCGCVALLYLDCIRMFCPTLNDCGPYFVPSFFVLHLQQVDGNSVNGVLLSTNLGDRQIQRRGYEGTECSLAPRPAGIG